ncbi:hypothetical protein CesoFtcFv8_004281 [Champsocephalus esox]|uniref:Uncharacterized protein n=2 Tax=Champsocephalus TaxID=52236 RepID=A0AAN8HZ09_CHAGU|nr:hypothetical protein CesoFtcFv8_004281 [Champsocephalus esox]KAK5933052.1 hypothetical protein CgunFtcFv8_004710 [Champsocephalus gunnari]
MTPGHETLRNHLVLFVLPGPASALGNLTLAFALIPRRMRRRAGSVRMKRRVIAYPRRTTVDELQTRSR